MCSLTILVASEGGARNKSNWELALPGLWKVKKPCASGSQFRTLRFNPPGLSSSSSRMIGELTDEGSGEELGVLNGQLQSIPMMNSHPLILNISMFRYNAEARDLRNSGGFTPGL